MKLASIVGARPNFIKAAAVVRALEREKSRKDRIEHLLIHTGQHYDYELDQVFFDELRIPKPVYHLGVGSRTHGEQTGRMLEQIERALFETTPDMVLVYGDTNSTLAGALAAVKLHIPVAHAEAGLRSYNKQMPEEINRIITDHVSTILFCSTETAVKNLKREGFTNIANDGKLALAEEVKSPKGDLTDNPLVINVGDVMLDSVLHNLSLAKERSSILKDIGLEGQEYYVATVHRAENTDNPKRLEQIFSAFQKLASNGVKVACPLHPRTKEALYKVLGEQRWHPNLHLLNPVSYLDMLLLEKNARIILTDSGGIQKEAFILRVPCVTLRGETEWVETVEAGWNLLAGADEQSILRSVTHFNKSKLTEPHIDPYGLGDASERMVRLISGYFLKI
jgi:UDP-GlcNAc3NAcA epimerase